MLASTLCAQELQLARAGACWRVLQRPQMWRFACPQRRQRRGDKLASTHIRARSIVAGCSVWIIYLSMISYFICFYK
jgi:hypothetical protein